MNIEVKERFLKYIACETRADGEREEVPSSSGQRVFGQMLLEELNAMGVERVEMDEKGFIYGKLPANDERYANSPVVGFIAHMDTATELPGPGKSVRLIANYDGGAIPLCADVFLRPENCSILEKVIGNDLIVTNGGTLLGGDDKAGVAELMAAIEYMLKHPELKHGEVAFAFTPDEEIGRSMKHFDEKKFGAQYAYTLDGEGFGTIEFENFCNGAAEIFFSGRSSHPGYAKGVMKNALNIAAEFHQLVPAWERAEHSAGYEGYYHLVVMEGNVQQSKIAYLIKDFEEKSYARRKERIERAVNWINEIYGEETAKVKFTDGQMNMAQIIRSRFPESVEIAMEEMKECGIEPEITPIRGGTDGVSLTFKGIPCPNLGTGTFNHHSIFEFASVDQMEKCVELILRLTTRFAAW